LNGTHIQVFICQLEEAARERGTYTKSFIHQGKGNTHRRKKVREIKTPGKGEHTQAFICQVAGKGAHEGVHPLREIKQPEKGAHTHTKAFIQSVRGNSQRKWNTYRLSSARWPERGTCIRRRSST
jgi:hypothetical protein